MARGRREASRKQMPRNSYIYTAAALDCDDFLKRGKRERSNFFGALKDKFNIKRKKEENIQNKSINSFKAKLSKSASNILLPVATGVLAVAVIAYVAFDFVTNRLLNKNDAKDDDFKAPIEQFDDTDDKIMNDALEFVPSSAALEKDLDVIVDSSPINEVSSNTYASFSSLLGTQTYAERLLNNGLFNMNITNYTDASASLMPTSSSEVATVNYEPAVSTEEVDFASLSVEEKVNYLMKEYNLNLQELHAMLGDLEMQVSDEIAARIEEVNAVSASNVVALDFSGYYKYEGTDEALMQVYGASEEEWITICKTIIHEAGAENGYIEAFATTTTVINRIACTKNSLYGVITADGQFESYFANRYKSIGDIYSDKYADSMAGIRDALYNFAIDQSKRIHDDYQFRAHGTGKFSRHYTPGGNEFGMPKSSSIYSYVPLDTTPLQSLGLVLTP